MSADAFTRFVSLDWIAGTGGITENRAKEEMTGTRSKVV